jgi:hypothetical protein
MSTVALWVIGLFISLVVGQLAAGYLVVNLRKYLHNDTQFKSYSKEQKFCFYFGIDFYPPLDPSERQIPAYITGPTERLFFTLLVAFDISGAAVAMVAWIGLKMATSKSFRNREESESVFPFELTGLLGNLTSMLFALAGGVIICQ